MKEKVILAKNILSLYVFLFLIWGLYRFLFRLPEEIEEIVLKPLIWLGPLFWLLFKEKENLASVGWRFQGFFKSLFWGVVLGIIFALLGFLTHLVKYQGISFVGLASLATPSLFLGALALSLITAVSEETVFRGYFFNRLWQVLKNEGWANLLSSFGWVLIHLPITLFVFHYNLTQILIFLFLSFLYGVGAAFLFARTGTIVAPVLLHVFWGWPILLFR